MTNIEKFDKLLTIFGDKAKFFPNLLMNGMNELQLTEHPQIEDLLLNKIEDIHQRNIMLVYYTANIKKKRWKDAEKLLIGFPTEWQDYKTKVLDVYGIGIVGEDQENLGHDISVLFEKTTN